MNNLTAQEVQQKLAQNPDTKLVMVLGTEAFRKGHIPHSLDISDAEAAKAQLPLGSQIIVYCSDEACPASIQAYHQLEAAGYRQIWRFAGGLMEWAAAGYELVMGE